MKFAGLSMHEALEASDERVPPILDKGYFCNLAFRLKQGKTIRIMRCTYLTLSPFCYNPYSRHARCRNLQLLLSRYLQVMA